MHGIETINQLNKGNAADLAEANRIIAAREGHPSQLEKAIAEHKAAGGVSVVDVTNEKDAGIVDYN